LPSDATIPGFPLTYAHTELLFTMGLAALTYLLVSRLTQSPYGRVLRGQKDDEIAAKSLGKNTSGYRLTAFLVSAALASLWGSIYIHHVGVLSPGVFSFAFMVTALVIVILGGLGSTLGAALGAVLYVVFEHVALQTSVLASETVDWDVDWSALRILLFSAILVLVMIFRPRGLMGGRDWTVRETVRRVAARLRGWRRGPA
ncbi:MAG TPA: branched-chain amino acid ABC transporter permease, partial [Candidatus Thermoplasmatota archaeon]|nr:branched-chain amino acid ABC transporter permease [Candidatus Thermoplasmatota archaeon]